MLRPDLSIALVCFFAAVGLVQADVKFSYHGPPVIENHTGKRSATWGTILQKVDNFNAQENRTWEMRYLYNREFYQPGGPMVIYLGGEWTIYPSSIEVGLIADIAKEHNGFLFYTEHRYYGESQPLSDWSTENLAYLSVDQALADVAYFIEKQKQVNPSLEGAKVVVIGGSYSAEMATWMRLKYPHLVDAAWSSSAPLVAQVDFPEYFEVVARSIKQVSEPCYQVLEGASKITRQLIETEEGRAIISENFFTCNPLKNEFPYDQHFWMTVTAVFAGIVQYAWPGDIKEQCDKVLGADGSDDMEKLGAFVKGYYNGGCLGDYDEYVKYLGDTKITNTNHRQWFYQICTEFGYLQTTTSVNQPFGENTLTPTYYDRVCNDLFGPGFGLELMEVSVNRTNRIYGGRNKALTKVVSIHGTVDPWHTPGILESLNELAPAKLVEGAAHCQDMGSQTPSDSEQMQEAKRLILDSIAQWIQ